MIRKVISLIGVVLFTSCSSASPSVVEVENKELDLSQDYICEPVSKQYCESGTCEDMAAEVWVEVDMNMGTASRCDEAGCDTYNVSTENSGLYTLISRTDVGGWEVKIDSTTGEYIENVTLGLGSYISYGGCSNVTVESSLSPQATEVVDQEITMAYIDIYDANSIERSANGAYYVYGETSDNCKEVYVTATNSSANLYDHYALEQYEYGDVSFRYGIREDLNNLAEGENMYSFEAHCDGDQVVSDGVSFSYTVPEYTYSYPETNTYAYEASNDNESSDDYEFGSSYTYGSSYLTVEYLYNSGAYLISTCDDDYVFLGEIGGRHDSDSIFSKYNDYGSKYSDLSIWYKYGDYGGEYSSCSPFYDYASEPPIIMIGSEAVAYLSQYKYAGGTVVDPNELLLFAYQKFDDDHWLDLIRD